MWQMNEQAKIINTCISITAYIIYSQWVICNVKDTAFQNVNMYQTINARLKFYGHVLNNTKLFKKLGYEIIKVAECLSNAQIESTKNFEYTITSHCDWYLKYHIFGKVIQKCMVNMIRIMYGYVSIRCHMTMRHCIYIYLLNR